MPDETKYYLPVEPTKWFFPHETNHKDAYIRYVEQNGFRASVSHFGPRPEQTGVTAMKEVTKTEFDDACSRSMLVG